MQRFLTILLLGLTALTSLPAYACKPIVAAQTFIDANDKNSDRVLTPSEWTQTDIENLQLNFKTTAKDFNRLDRDGNGKLTAAELRRHISFKKNPCEGWPWED